MQMVDQGDADDKIIAVAANDPSINYINNIEELPKHFFEELRHFFQEYKRLENKSVIVEEFQDKATAIGIINQAMEFYRAHFLTELTKA
jgi:inorganic pyrophosphatase